MNDFFVAFPFIATTGNKNNNSAIAVYQVAIYFCRLIFLSFFLCFFIFFFLINFFFNEKATTAHCACFFLNFARYTLLNQINFFHIF